ncbi:MAG TPA: hypothetical protein VGF32_05455 [Streptosporangiaceae bacterium]|jgi:hypothetical protein
MSKIHKKIAAVLGGAALAMTLGFVAIPATAAHASVDPGVCHDGITLADAYYGMGDYATANRIIWNLVDMGCAQN